MTTPDPHTNLRIAFTIVNLEEGDITESGVDAIVNPANTNLVLGAGVAGAIDRKGGPGVQKECDRLRPIQVGQAVLTGGGKLRARHVIHAVGPRMGEGEEDRKLADATRSVLRLATEYHLSSVAFPAISTGVFGYPKERCAKVMLQATVEFLESEKTSLREIVFCLYDTEAFNLFRRELDRHRMAVEARRA